MAENTPPKWQTDLCYSTPNDYKHMVNGKEQKFFPVSVGLLMELRKTGVDSANAIAKLFANASRDTKTVDNTTTKTDGTIERTVVIEPVTLEMAKYRDEQQAGAWTKAIEAITEPKTMELLASIIMDSLSEVFPKDENGNSPVDPAKFLKATKLTTLSQMIVGVAKGNQDVFGPLGLRVRSVLSNLEKAVDSKLSALGEPATTETTTPNAN